MVRQAVADSGFPYPARAAKEKDLPGLLHAHMVGPVWAAGESEATGSAGGRVARVRHDHIKQKKWCP